MARPLNKLETLLIKDLEYVIQDDNGYGCSVSPAAAKYIAKYVKRLMKKAWTQSRGGYFDSSNPTFEKYFNQIYGKATTRKGKG